MIRVILFIAVLLIAMPANATLLDRGNGMIYCPEINVTFLQDANIRGTLGYPTWGSLNFADANAFADQFVYGGFDDWRLPSAYTVGSTDPPPMNYAATDTELGHLFYSEGISNAHPGIFYNLGAAYPAPGYNMIYWTSTPNYAYWMTVGGQVQDGPEGINYLWLCRTGDVLQSETPVPEPSILLLLVIGIITNYRLKSFRPMR